MTRFSARVPAGARPNALSQAVAERRRRGQAFIDLTVSNPTLCGFRAHAPRLLKPLSKKSALGYRPDPRGDLAARQAVCAYYSSKGLQVRPENVFLTASTSEAYHFLFRLLCDAGDRAATAEPSYPLLDSLMALDDVTASKYRLRYDGAWRIDPDTLAAAAEGAKAVIAVHPNNPTGHFVSTAERADLNGACRRAQAALIVDEVFHDYAWKKKASSFAANPDVLTFTLSGLSKVMGLPQMKVGWIVISGPADERAEASERLETIADAYLSVNTPAQLALPAWLRTGQAVTREILERVRANRRALEKELDGSLKLSLLEAEGGWVSLLKFDSTRDDEDLSLHLLEKKAVHVHPGYLYDLPEDLLVISLLVPEKTFLEGLRRIMGAY